MKTARIFASLSTVLALATACGSDTYDYVPVDVLYKSTATGGFDVTLADGKPVHVEKFGLAIGFTRIHLCEDTTVASTFGDFRLRDLLVPIAHAHSPSTPTSSGIPIILSTEAVGTEDLVEAALRPVRGVEVCAVEIQLLASDDDAHLLEFLPEIEGAASSALIDGEWIHSGAGRSRTFPIDPPLVIDGEISFHVTLDGDLWETKRNISPSQDESLDSLQSAGDALQDAAMDSLILNTLQHIPADN